MWTTIQIILGLLGLLLAFGGERLSIPVLFYAGVGCFGLASLAIGWEAMITRHIVIGRRHSRETYTGIAAMAQGAQFNLIGLFLIGVSFVGYFNTGQGLFLQMVRRPGLALIAFGIICLMQALITIPGSREHRNGPRWIAIMNLLVSRLLPGLILVGVGLGAMGLGLFEIIAPNAFDEMGGGFLEVLYGVK